MHYDDNLLAITKQALNFIANAGYVRYQVTWRWFCADGGKVDGCGFVAGGVEQGYNAIEAGAVVVRAVDEDDVRFRSHAGGVVWYRSDGNLW